VFPPDVDNVVGEGRAGRTIVVETSDTAIDVEGGRIEVLVLWWLLVQWAGGVGVVGSRAFISCSKEALSKGLPLCVVVSLGIGAVLRCGTLYLKHGGVVEKFLVG
jgi:hypothetical protein